METIPTWLWPLLLLLLLFSTTKECSAYGTAPRMLFLVKQQGPILEYHNGLLLRGDYKLNLIWYGAFTPSQHAIVSDFFLSINPKHNQEPPPPPSVFSWWQTTDYYKGDPTRFTLGNQVFIEDYSLGKTLSLAQIQDLASTNAVNDAINIVLTSADVTVEGFCRSNCGIHGPVEEGKIAYIWVGNSGSQCPGQCAWPFAQPYYGPQTPPLKSPNGDVGMDGMIINIATLLAGTVTNPFDGGYFQGPATAPFEAVSACTGIFGKGAYPGNPGAVMIDQTTGGSYNARGLYGRMYLLPAMWDPNTSNCSTLI